MKKIRDNKIYIILYVLIITPVFLTIKSLLFITVWCWIWAIVFIIFKYLFQNKTNLPINNDSLDSTINQNTETIEYVQKPFMTASEHHFYNKMKELETEYKIVPQINLATIIKKQGASYYTDLFRNIDFAIFDKDYNQLLLLIELNDITHNQKKRIYRDNKIKEICKQSNINLITFYTKYSNEKDYVLSRIRQEINKKQ